MGHHTRDERGSIVPLVQHNSLRRLRALFSNKIQKLGRALHGNSGDPLPSQPLKVYSCQVPRGMVGSHSPSALYSSICQWNLPTAMKLDIMARKSKENTGNVNEVEAGRRDRPKIPYCYNKHSGWPIIGQDTSVKTDGLAIGVGACPVNRSNPFVLIILVH